VKLTLGVGLELNRKFSIRLAKTPGLLCIILLTQILERLKKHSVVILVTPRANSSIGGRIGLGGVGVVDRRLGL